MAIDDWPEDVVVVSFTAEIDARDELEKAIDVVRKRGDCDVLVDLSDVEVFTSSHMASLLRLRTLLEGCRHRLVLCNVSPLIRGVLSVTGLDDVFEIKGDRLEALATVQTCH